MAATVWRGRLAFGMVSIPVRMYKAARRERVRFHHVYRPEPAREPEPEEEPEPATPVSKVREMPRPQNLRMAEPEIEEDAQDEAPAPVERVHNVPSAAPDKILKGYELEKDRFVVLEPSEIAALRPRTSSELDILEFVHLDEIDPLFFDVSYYLAADRGGEKAYALLYTALRDSGYVALGSLAMHGREHALVIRAGSRGMIAHTLYYANEVRSAEEYTADPSLVKDKELELATTVVKAMAAKFDPAKLKDTFEERLRALIESREPASVIGETASAGAPTGPVVDIMEALRKSLEMARKPAQSETGGKKSPRRKSK